MPTSIAIKGNKPVCPTAPARVEATSFGPDNWLTQIENGEMKASVKKTPRGPTVITAKIGSQSIAMTIRPDGSASVTSSQATATTAATTATTLADTGTPPE